MATTSDSLVEHLESLPFFAGLSGSGVGILIEHSSMRTFRKGEIVFREAEYGFEFYVILSGSVRAFTTTARGGDRELGTIETDDFFGEMGPMVGMRRSATVVAAEDTVLLEISEDDFHALASKVPSFKEHIDKAYLSRALSTALAFVPLFQSFSMTELQRLATKAELVSYQADETVIRTGDRPDYFYLIRRGFVKVTKEVEGETKLLAYLTDNAWFGEMALLDSRPRRSNIVALGPVEVVRIPAATFVELVDENSAVRGQIRNVADARRQQTTSPGQGGLAALMQGGLLGFDEVLAIDLKTCVRCGNCEAGCARTHDGYPRLIRRGFRIGDTLIPASCNQCPDPACMKACRFGAMARGRDGAVSFRDHCNGCQRCVTACPYGVIGIAERPVLEQPGRSWWERLLGSPKSDDEGACTAVKCDMCAGLPTMACVAECPTGALQRVDPKTLLDED